MTATRTISVTSWSQFQHYKDRDPPWIKLYRDTLTSEVWVLGTDTSRLVQIASTLLAARYKNAIPLNFELWQRVAHLACTEAQFLSALDHLIKHRFVSIQVVESVDSGLLATCATQDEGPVLRVRAEQSRAEGEQSGARGVLPEAERERMDEFAAWRRAYHPAWPFSGPQWQEGEREYWNLRGTGEPAATLLEAAIADVRKRAVTGDRPHNPGNFLKGGHWRGPFDIPKTPEQRAADERAQREAADIARLKQWALEIGCPHRPLPQDSPATYETRIQTWKAQGGARGAAGPKPISAILAGGSKS